MARRRRRSPPLPFVLAELTLASWQTIMLRSALMASGGCSAAEYQRMVLEKLTAAQRSAMVLALSGGRCTAEAVLAPWQRSARANAKRLSRR